MTPSFSSIRYSKRSNPGKRSTQNENQHPSGATVQPNTCCYPNHCPNLSHENSSFTPRIDSAPRASHCSGIAIAQVKPRKCKKCSVQNNLSGSGLPCEDLRMASRLPHLRQCLTSRFLQTVLGYSFSFAHVLFWTLKEMNE